MKVTIVEDVTPSKVLGEFIERFKTSEPLEMILTYLDQNGNLNACILVSSFEMGAELLTYATHCLNVPTGRA
jgi:hypothetical protein